MRRLFFVGFFLLLVVAAAACASILGDYGTATVETSDEGGRDASSPDTSVPLGEGGRDAAIPIDGGTDAPPLLSCGETSQGGRIQITDAGLVYQGFRIASQSGGNDAIIVAIEQGDAGMNAHAYIPSGGQTTDAQLVGLYQILDIERYSGGFAILALLNDSPSQYFGVYTIGDTDIGWHPVQQVSEDNPLPNNWGNLSGALAVVDAGTGAGDGDFIVAVLDTDVPNGPQVLRAQRETGSAMQPLAVVDPNLTPHAFQMNSPAIAFDSTNAYVLLSSNGPMSSPVGDGGVPSALYALPAMNIPDGGTRTLLTPPVSSALLSFGLTTSGQNPMNADLGLYEVNENVVPPTIAYLVGQAPTTSLGSLAWQQLPSTSPPPAADAAAFIENIIVGGSGLFAHWESFPTSDNLLVAKPTTSETGDVGVNLGWWNAQTGALRAEQVGPSRLLNNVIGLQNATATFTGPPNPGLASIILGYQVVVNPDAGTSQQQPSNLWITQLTCL